MSMMQYAPWKGIVLTLAPLLPASFLLGPVAGQGVAFAAAAAAMIWAIGRRV